MTYLYVCKDLPIYIPDPQEQTLLIAFLEALYNPAYVDACKTEYGFTLVADILDVKQYADAAIAMLKENLSDGAQEWFIEKDTNDQLGHGPFVFSFNRREIVDLRIADLDDAIGALDTTDLVTLLSDVEKVKAEVGIGGDSNKLMSAQEQLFASKDQTQIQAALALSSLSFALWMLWIGAFAYRWLNGSSGATTAKKGTASTSVPLAGARASPTTSEVEHVTA
jgi:hypothetical protein